MFRNTILLLLFAGLLLAGLAFVITLTEKPEPVVETVSQTEEPAVITEKIVEVGNLLMVGHWANTPIASTTALIADIHAGGVIIMSTPENPEEISGWVAQWNAVSDTPLLIAIDQEGGPVTRLKGPDFIQTGQREITSAEEAYRVGHERGEELAALGINVNFSPVLDSATNPDSFMYSRIFPSSTDASTLAGAMTKGMKEAGVTAVAKHFPGHGDTPADSHLTLSEVNISKNELGSFTAKFRDYITNEQPKALMTAHVLFPKIDPLPATLSSFFLKDYLRNQLQFNGLIITDDMSMDAIDSNWSTDEATVLSVQSGADLVLFAAEPEKARDAATALQTALDSGTLKAEDIQKSISRGNALR